MELIAHEIEGDVMILAADGGLNSDNSATFVSEIETLIDGGLDRLIVDCTKLDYISSYGLGVLLTLSKRMKSRGGMVKLAGLKGIVVQAMHMARLDGFFEIYEDVNRARLSFREP